MKKYSFSEAGELLEKSDFYSLALEADDIRRKLHPEGVVTYIVDRNINYTNICICKCKFCAFYRDISDADAYLMSFDELSRKIEDTIRRGGTQILLQGGLHPGLSIDWYVDMLKFIKKNYNIWVHGFSPPEIAHIAKNSNKSIAEVIKILTGAGLDSIPGGGAELLSDSVRREISPNKINSDVWLEVMRQAHLAGLKTTATMMFRKGEKAENIAEHLIKIRNLQEETGGFTAFIPWPFQPGNTELGGDAASAYEYLRVLSFSRIVLYNIKNIQLSWVTQGEKIAQVGLFFGANDFGSVMMEENVVRAAGTSFSLEEDKIREIIKSAGFIPKVRNMRYDIVEES